MDPLISFGIGFITAFQSMGAWLEAPMKFFTFIGSPNFYLIFLPLVYWCIDAALGIGVGFILMIGTGLNLLPKMALHGPRPYWVSTNVRALASETLFGVPSTHAQIGAGFWGDDRGGLTQSVGLGGCRSAGLFNRFITAVPGGPFSA